MRSLLLQYTRVTIVTLTIVLLLSAFPSISSAAGPSVTVTGTGTAPCGIGGKQVSSLVQGEAFDIAIDGFPVVPVGAPSDQVGLTFTFPDGHVLNTNDVAAPVPPIPAFANYGAWGAPAVALPAPIDPVSAAYIYGVPVGATLTWPIGCYTLTATEIGPAPNLSATAKFALLPLQHNTQSGNLKLNVQAVGTAQPIGQQPATAATPILSMNIFGQGVPAGSVLVVHIVQPNGAITEINPVPAASIVQGNFALAPYGFTAAHPVGTYTIYAIATMPSGAIYTARAEFKLTAAPVTPTNNASLEILDPFTALVTQGAPMVFQARKFGAGPLGLTLVLPDGARFFGGVLVNGSGNAQIGPLALGKGFPIGAYQLVATQTNPPFAIARTAQTAWHLIP